MTYKPLLIAEDLTSLAERLQAFKEAYGELWVVTEIMPHHPLRTAMALCESRPNGEHVGLYLLHGHKGWVDHPDHVKNPDCEDCGQSMTQSDLRQYEAEAGFSAGWPRVCYDCPTPGR